jgi:hypothetical protein
MAATAVDGIGPSMAAADRAPSKPLANLERVTSEYVVAQDRIRFSGAQPGGGVVVFWLTQRLLLRMLPALLTWLGAQQPDVLRAEALQSFAQQAARTQSQTQPQDLVQGDDAAPGWLVESVDVTQLPQALRLTFKAGTAAGDVCASWPALSLPAPALRQWLNILFDNCRAAGWPLDAWPEWMHESVQPQESRAPVLH